LKEIDEAEGRGLGQVKGFSSLAFNCEAFKFNAKK